MLATQQRDELRQGLEEERERRIPAEAQLVEQQKQAAEAHASQATSYSKQIAKLEAQVAEKEAVITMKTEEADHYKQQLGLATAAIANKDEELARQVQVAAADRATLQQIMLLAQPAQQGTSTLLIAVVVEGM
jgi:hypothetical protein